MYVLALSDIARSFSLKKTAFGSMRVRLSDPPDSNKSKIRDVP